MGIRLSPAGSNYLSRTDVLAAAGAQTWFLRFQVHSLPASGTVMHLALVQHTGAFTGWGLVIDSNGNLRLLALTHEAAYTGTTELELDTTYTLWLRITGSGTAQNAYVYLNGSTTPEIDPGVGRNWNSGGTNINLGLGYRPSFNITWAGTQAYADVTYQDVRCWTIDRAVATNFQAEIDSCGAAASTTSLRGDWSLADTGTLTDASGNGLTLTNNGTGASNGAALCSEGGGTTYEQALAGSVTPAGALVRTTQRALTASTTPAGALVRRLERALAGTLSPVGSLLRLTARALAGSVTPVGALARGTARALGGAATPAGATEAIRAALFSVSGSVAPTGGALARAEKAISGTVSPAAGLTRQSTRPLAGTVTPAGQPNTHRWLAIAGTITPSGVVTKRIPQRVSGTLASSGAIATAAGQVLSAGPRPHRARLVIDLPAARLLHAPAAATLTVAPAGATIEP